MSYKRRAARYHRRLLSCVGCGGGHKDSGTFGIPLIQKDVISLWYARNMSFFVLPLLAGYFAWKRRLDIRTLSWLAVAFITAVIFANVYPFARQSSTGVLTALHVPIALWLAVGIAYAGGRWNQIGNRMDFIRFSGELFIYYVLIALGGGVFMAFMSMIFKAIGITSSASSNCGCCLVERSGQSLSPPGW